jgi:AcrR family transcriptional regulator
MVMANKNRGTRLGPGDWLRAALARLTREGVEAVRVELLARDLGVSKGSFYWHFRDRGDLLEKLLAAWEKAESDWLEGEVTEAAAATRWARFVERTSDAQSTGMAVALAAWARQDEHVAIRMAVIERKKTVLIADVLHDIGFDRARAESWAGVILLVCLGWTDRATRDRQPPRRTLGELLSDVILAASVRSPAVNR